MNIALQNLMCLHGHSRRDCDLCCPHTTVVGRLRTGCSLCMMAVPRKVEHVRGELLVGGEIQERAMDLGKEVAQPRNTGTIVTGKRAITCTRCGRQGHKRNNCHGQEATVGTGAMISVDKEDAA
jgi:hypothetical protein